MLKVFIVVFANVLVFSDAKGTCPTFYTFSNGATADASQVNSDFSYILECPYFTGNVGIGTPTPSETLHIYGSGLALSDSSLTNYYKFAPNDSQTQLNIGYYVLGAWYPATGIPAMTLTYTGLIGIGTTSPSQTLQVNGTALVTPSAAWGGGTTAYIYAGDTNNGLSATYGGYVNVFGYNGVTISSATGTNMTVTSTAVYGPTYYTTSDKRLKKDIVPIDGALAMIENLRGVRFNWRTPTNGRWARTLSFLRRILRSVSSRRN